MKILLNIVRAYFSASLLLIVPGCSAEKDFTKWYQYNEPNMMFVSDLLGDNAEIRLSKEKTGIRYGMWVDDSKCRESDRVTKQELGELTGSGNLFWTSVCSGDGRRYYDLAGNYSERLTEIFVRGGIATITIPRTNKQVMFGSENFSATIRSLYYGVK